MKHSYQVQSQSEIPQQDDASFRVCLCTMLVILALFGLTSVFLWKSVDHRSGPDKGSGDNSASGSSYLHGHVKEGLTTTTIRTDPSLDKEQVQTHERVVTNHPSTEATSGEVTESSTKTTPVSNTRVSGKINPSTEDTTGEVTESSTKTTPVSNTRVSGKINPSTEDTTGEVTESSTKTTPVSNTEISVETKQYQTTTSHFPSTVTAEVPTINKTQTSKSTTVEETESSTSYYINNPVSSYSEDNSVTEETNILSTFYINDPQVRNPDSSYFENTTPVSKSIVKVTTESSTENLASISQKTENVSEISSTVATTEVQYLDRNYSLIDKINKLVKDFEVETFSTTTENDVDVSEDNVGKKMKFNRHFEHFGTTTEEVSYTVVPGTSSDTTANESTSTHSTSTESSVRKAKIITEETTTSVVAQRENSTEKTDFVEDTPQDSSTPSEAEFKTDITTVQTCPTPAAPVCPMCVVPTCPACPMLQCPTTTTVAENTPVTEDKVCKTKQCYATAGRILSLVDATVDPCEDFYLYACGGILDNPTVLDEDPAIDVWDRIKKAVKTISPLSPMSHQKLKNYYEGCVHYDKLISEEERRIEGRKILDSVAKLVNATSDLENDFTEHLINLFKLQDISEFDINVLMFPGRKILDSVAKFVNDTSDPENDFTELLINLFKHGSEPLFRLQLDVDCTNSSFFQMVVTVPDWSSSHFRPAAERSKQCRHKPSDQISENLVDAYEAYTNCKNNFSSFMDTTQKALEYFGVFDYMSQSDASHFIQKIRMSIEFDILDLIAELPAPVVVQDNIQKKNFQPILKPQLQSMIPQVSWSFLFSTLLKVDLKDDSIMQVYFLDKIQTFFEKLQSKNMKNIQNSLMAIFAHDLYKDLMLTHSPYDREQYCLQVAANLMPAVVSNLYLGTYPADTERELRTQVKSLSLELEAAMKEKLKEAGWLDKNTLNQVEMKLNFMSIALPQMFNESFLNTSLEECSLDEKHYVKDSACLVRQYQTLLYSRYTLDPHSVDVMWSHFLTAFSTQTTFINGLNTFMIPLAVVGPVYGKEFPRHVVMARLGNILARGIGHNFDHTGIKFDGVGKFGIMLSEETNPSYDGVVKQSNMQFEWMLSHKENNRVYKYLLPSDLTLNQRLSDVTAANLSLSTILELKDTELPWVPFNSRQVYFISLAQTFCSKKKIPEVFMTLYEGTTLLPFDRIKNLVINSDQFATAFSCPLGAIMNPEIKVRPFPLFEKVDETDKSYDFGYN